MSTKLKPRFALALAAYLAIAALAIYLLMPAPQPNSEAESLTARANDLYMQFTRSNNEAAIALHEKVLAMDKDYAPAQAGLAKALVQRDMHQTEPATKTLSRATALAERAVRLAPRDADALKALGFAYTAQNRIDEAACRLWIRVKNRLS